MTGIPAVPSPPAGVHPWHDIPVGPGEKAPDVVHALIEIPEGSKVKFEIDKVCPTALIDQAQSRSCGCQLFSFLSLRKS
jgi:inorganic pyrophosphatase